MPPSRFGGWTPKQDPRVQFSIYRVSQKLHFLNQTTQVVDKVTYTSIGVVRTDDEGGVVPTTFFDLSYDSVLSGEAVLLDELDDYFDGDSFIQIVIEVQAGGKAEIFSASGKGGPSTTVLKKIELESWGA